MDYRDFFQTAMGADTQPYPYQTRLASESGCYLRDIPKEKMIPASTGILYTQHKGPPPMTRTQGVLSVRSSRGGHFFQGPPSPSLVDRTSPPENLEFAQQSGFDPIIVRCDRRAPIS